MKTIEVPSVLLGRFVLTRGNFETDSEKNYCTSTVHGSAHLKRKILIIDVKKCGPRLFIL